MMLYILSFYVIHGSSQDQDAALVARLEKHTGPVIVSTPKFIYYLVIIIIFLYPGLSYFSGLYFSFVNQNIGSWVGI